jgi:hypothetical protein|tara:strand:- start:607 stop:795 length:189 start_codon:yes stop_codon:yes gene_type:complete
MAGLVPTRNVRKQIRQEEAVERNTAYREMISTPEGIAKYIETTNNIGRKQMQFLVAKQRKLV